MKASRLLILAAAAVLVAGAPALAFHDGGVAHCNGCHTMHNSQNGVGVADDGQGGTLPVGQGNVDLLLFANKTDVCLSCHAGGGTYHIWSDNAKQPNEGTANRGGGDFVFLEETNINDAHAGADNPVLGYAAGHSVISAIKGTVQDPALASSPGGSYSSANMACSSCHDPHGNSSYRLLYQDGQSVDTALFTATVEADGISLFAGGGAAETNDNHNAYHANFSAWCATCHGDFHQGSANLIHPSGQTLGADIAATYNLYDGTSDCVANPPQGQLPCGSGAQATAYLAAVPFEDAATTTSSTAGPTANSRVACMTCHRAHATSAMDAGRWDFNITGLAEDGQESGSYAIPNPYDDFQRSLCNKCHSQDEYDELLDFDGE